MRMTLLSAAILAGAFTFAAAPRADEGWDPARAATYLDTRQQKWFAWPQAASADGPCVSCHTGMPYLLARPALRKVLHEPAPTQYEVGLVNRLAARAGNKPAGALQGVETIFATMFVEEASARQRTFDQLWALQKNDGPLKGGWQWYNANLDPWETSAQFRYGAAFAALAIGSAPASFRAAPDVQDRIRALEGFLQDEAVRRPMHVRLMTLLATGTLPGVMTPAARRATIDEVVKTQQQDGGWSLAALGPWDEHAAAPKSLDLAVSNSYATAFTAYVLKTAGGKAARKATSRALDWLRKHQDRESGAWPAVSMNKLYPPDSMMKDFMQDAATAFAVLALTAN